VEVRLMATTPRWARRSNDLALLLPHRMVEV